MQGVHTACLHKKCQAYGILVSPYAFDKPATDQTRTKKCRRHDIMVKKIPAAQCTTGSRITFNLLLSTCYFEPLAAAITASETLAGGGA